MDSQPNDQQQKPTEAAQATAPAQTNGGANAPAQPAPAQQPTAAQAYRMPQPTSGHILDLYLPRPDSPASDAEDEPYNSCAPGRCKYHTHMLDLQQHFKLMGGAPAFIREYKKK